VGCGFATPISERNFIVICMLLLHILCETERVTESDLVQHYPSGGSLAGIGEL